MKDDIVAMGIATTGLGKLDEVIEISIVNINKEVLFNGTIKPLVTIAKEINNGNTSNHNNYNNKHNRKFNA